MKRENDEDFVRPKRRKYGARMTQNEILWVHELISCNDTNPKAYWYAGNFLVHPENYEAKRNFFIQSVELGYNEGIHDLQDTCFNEGDDLEQEGYYEAAIEVFKIPLRFQCDNECELMARIGRCHEEMGEFETSMDWYEKAVEIGIKEVDVDKFFMAEEREFDMYREALEKVNPEEHEWNETILRESHRLGLVWSDAYADWADMTPSYRFYFESNFPEVKRNLEWHAASQNFCLKQFDSPFPDRTIEEILSFLYFVV